MRLPRLLSAVLCFAPACTVVLGIDGDHESSVRRDVASGGSSRDLDSGASGGTLGGGGSPSGGSEAGGSGGSGGGGGGGGGDMSDARAMCAEGEKRCPFDGEEYCVPPNPGVGCGPTGCVQCAAPLNGFGTCDGEDCDFDCFPGFVRNGSVCDPIATGDAGHGDAGGPTGGLRTCTTSADCPPCGLASGCCALLPANTCGCNFVWCTVFIPLD